MKKRDIARRLAQKTGVTPGEAADQVDRTVNDLLRKLRSAGSADLPGFGHFEVTQSGSIEFQPERNDRE